MTIDAEFKRRFDRIDTDLHNIKVLLDAIADHVLSEPDRTRHEIYYVERYLSNSGNTTWKAFNKNDDIIYLRQAHKALLREAGLFGDLDMMHDGDGWKADIVLYTVPDGDFMKPVAIEPGGWVKP
jgi:hypothetical protein